MFSTPPAAGDALEVLTDINVDDLLDAAGLRALRATPLRQLFRPPARRFARLAQGFDERVGAHGLAAGSAWLLQQMTAGLDLRGAARLPASGPLLVLANHPGMTDTVALLSALAMRPDLKVIAADRPFLRALPQVMRSLILLPEGGGGHLTVLRHAAAHLSRGGALLSFPAGRIEPDLVSAAPGRARQSLQGWSGSAALLLGRVPQAQWLVAVVGNVVSADAQRHALTALRRRAEDKEKLAAALQVALPRYHRLSARVAFGPAMRATGPAAALHAAIVAQAAQLIDELPRGGDPVGTRRRVPLPHAGPQAGG